MTNIKRISPSFVVSSLALFVALSGAAMALPGTNTVNSGDVVNESLKSIDLKDNAAVASSDVIDGTLTTTDVAADTLTGDDVAPDSLAADELAPDSVTQSELANGSVGTVELQAQSVNGDKIVNNTVSSDDLAANSVRSEELGDGIQARYNTVAVAGGTAENGAYLFNTVTRSCLPGEELISASAEWTGDAAGDELFVSEVLLDHNAESVTVTGGNDSGDAAQLWAVAHCL